MRKNPTLTTSSAKLAPVMDGIDNLPNPIGKSMDAMEKGNAMPEVDMKTNNGDNPSIPDAAFATGKDTRVKDTQRGSDPSPSMPGAP